MSRLRCGERTSCHPAAKSQMGQQQTRRSCQPMSAWPPPAPVTTHSKTKPLSTRNHSYDNRLSLPSGTKYRAGHATHASAGQFVALSMFWCVYPSSAAVLKQRERQMGWTRSPLDLAFQDPVCLNAFSNPPRRKNVAGRCDHYLYNIDILVGLCDLSNLLAGYRGIQGCRYCQERPSLYSVRRFSAHTRCLAILPRLLSQLQCLCHRRQLPVMINNSAAYVLSPLVHIDPMEPQICKIGKLLPIPLSQHKCHGPEYHHWQHGRLCPGAHSI